MQSPLSPVKGQFYFTTGGVVGTFGKRLGRAQRLWEARSGERMSDKRLGELVGGYRGQSVSGWRKGTQAPPPVHVIELLARELNVSPAWLAFGEGPDPLTSNGGAETERPKLPMSDHPSGQQPKKRTLPHGK